LRSRGGCLGRSVVGAQQCRQSSSDIPACHGLLDTCYLGLPPLDLFQCFGVEIFHDIRHRHHHDTTHQHHKHHGVLEHPYEVEPFVRDEEVKFLPRGERDGVRERHQRRWVERGPWDIWMYLRRREIRLNVNAELTSRQLSLCWVDEHICSNGLTCSNVWL